MRTIDQLLEHIQSFGLEVHRMNWNAMIKTLRDNDDPVVEDIVYNNELMRDAEDQEYEKGQHWLVVIPDQTKRHPFLCHALSFGETSGRVYFIECDNRSADALYEVNGEDISDQNMEGSDDANLDPLWQYLTTDPE